MDSILGLSADTLVTNILRDYFRVPTGSQPLLNELTESVELGFHDHRRRHSHHKRSLQCSPLGPEVDVDNESHRSSPFPNYPINVDLPSVEEAERLHPLLMELDATPFLELDNSNSVRISIINYFKN